MTYTVRPSDRAFSRFLANVDRWNVRHQARGIDPTVRPSTFRTQRSILAGLLTDQSCPVALIQQADRYAGLEVATMHDLSLIRAATVRAKKREWRDVLTFAGTDRFKNEVFTQAQMDIANTAAHNRKK